MATDVKKHDSDDDWSSSDEDEAKGPPPMLNIEKSADLKAMKSAFLNATEKSPERKSIEIPRSEAEKKLVQKTFFEPPEKDEPKDCIICEKVVYQVDKISVKKSVFHKNCFTCCKCQQKLTAQNYSTREGKLYCKLHMLEITKPELALAYQKGELSAADLEHELEEEGDYVLVSKPKAHDPSVVKSSLKSADDLETVGSLKDKKSEWTKSAEQSSFKPEASPIDAQLIEQGGVKSKLSKFVEGEAGKEQKSDEEDETDQNRDPNIVKSSKKKEKINVEIGAKSIKGKWEAGTMERAHGDLEDRSQELDEIKKNVSVKDKYKEMTFAAEVEDAAKRKSTLGDEIGDTSFSSAAKERFLKGEAFQDTNPIEKMNVAEQIKFAELGNVKERFEKQPLDDAMLGARKKELLEAEFKQFEEARKISREAEQEAPDGGPKPEAVNKRVAGPDFGQPGSDDYEVKNLLNKFKNIEQGKIDEPKGPKPKRQITPPPDGAEFYKPEFKPELQEKEVVPTVSAEELAKIKVEAKNLKAKFENVATESKNDPEAEEKRKYLEEEFKKLKELKEQQEKEEAQMEPSQQPETDEKAADLAAAAEHGQKSRAKWEKIERKEKKKAQKAAQAANRSAQGAKEI